jgi:Carboxypeptidase regulatory-like domain
MKSMAILRIGVGVCLALLIGAATFAQTTGTIRGSVKDPSGAVVPGANITATLLGTATERTAASDKEGDFEIPELPVGHYSVTMEATGFKKFNLKDAEVSLGHVTLVNAALEVGEAAQTVTVESEAAQVETTSTQLGAVMNDVAVEHLPLATRNTYQLLQLQPGVQSQLGSDLFYGSDSPGVVSVNGGRGRSNNYMVNGGDGNDIFVNGPAIQPSPDAIEEFRVLTNTFDAEFGRNSGSVVNVVTKSGTNDIHGDVFEFFRNKILNTRGYFDPSTKDYKQNQFGATLGGPIKKDKTFIFGSYEGDRLRQGISSGLVTLPTAAEATGNFSAGAPFTGMLHDANFAAILGNRGATPGQCNTDVMAAQIAAAMPVVGVAAGNPYTAIFPNNTIPKSCFDPTALDLYNKYVAPFGTGTIGVIPVKRLRDDQFTVHFDHTLTAAQRLSVYYYFDDDAHQDPFSRFQQSGANLPGFGANFATRTQQWNISHTWTIGSSAVNEFRFNYFREGQGTLNHPQHFNDVHLSCSAAIGPAECFQDLNNSQIPNTKSAGLGITTNIPGREGVPFTSVSGGFVIGNNFNGELPQVGNTFQWMDNYSKVMGKHSLKFGADVRRQRFDQSLFFEINGAFTLLTKPNLCVGGAQPPGCTLPTSNDIGYGLAPGKNPDAYPDYFIGAVNTFAQGAAQGESVRNSGFYLFAQDSWKLTNSLTLNYGLRWELNTPYYDLGNRLQTFRPGQISKQYPCFLDPSLPASQSLITGGGYNQNCSVTTANPADPNFNVSSAVFPVGLVFPGDPGVPRGLTATYYKSFAPRVGLAWTPGWTEGWLSKLTGGPGKTSVRMGWGIFYNPIEQLVLEQFSAEPPFGGSSSLSNTLFNLPFENQAGFAAPNPFRGIINQTPKTPCPISGGPVGCVDWSKFRPLLLFGEFQPHLRAQYSVQYNFTIERELAKDLIMHFGYVGTQAHRLLASHDLNPGNAQTCLDLQAIAKANPNNLILNGISPGNCGPISADNQFLITANTVIPAQGLHLPYNAGPGGTFIPGGTVVGPAGINLVGLRPFSSPLCAPLTNVGCPSFDGNPVFGSIFAEDTIGNSNYNSLQAQIEKHYSRGLQFSASYTYSKAIDQGASFENELNPFNFRRSRGLSLVDARHRFVFSPYWELPIPKYSGFKGKLEDGWAVSAIVTYQSGFPIRFFDANDTELNSSFFFEPGNTPQINGRVQFLNPKARGNQYINAANITDPPAGQFGNSPHALCCGPAISNSDISIQKRTSISERINTEFRADIFNAFNHTQFANPDGNFSNQTFGQIQNTREDPRVVQFGLKILF